MEITAALLLIFYVHSVISNYVQLQSLKNMLAFYTTQTSLVAWGIVLVELATAVLLFIPKVRTVGFSLSAVLAVSLIIMILSTSRYPHDFGGVINELPNDGRIILLGVIAIVSLAGLFLGFRKQNTGQSIPAKTIYT